MCLFIIICPVCLYSCFRGAAEFGSQHVQAVAPHAVTTFAATGARENTDNTVVPNQLESQQTASTIGYRSSQQHASVDPSLDLPPEYPTELQPAPPGYSTAQQLSSILPIIQPEEPTPAHEGQYPSPPPYNEEDYL